MAVVQLVVLAHLGSRSGRVRVAVFAAVDGRRLRSYGLGEAISMMVVLGAPESIGCVSSSRAALFAILVRMR